MEWRCEWCGKPHEADDPPCDNCGHGSFERAVVRAPGGDVGSAETTVWVCPECGREHPKHSPPCSRCGNPTLESRTTGPADYDDVGAPSYRDLVTPRYLIALVAVLALAAVFVLGATGVVSLPGFDDGGVPAVEDVPGEGEEVGGLSLDAVETALVDALDERRDSAGLDGFRRSDRLDEVSRFYTERLVKSRAGQGTLPSRERLSSLVREGCGDSEALLTPRVLAGSDSVTSQDSVSAAGRALATHIRLQEQPPADRLGLAIHVGPEGSTYLTAIRC